MYFIRYIIYDWIIVIGYSKRELGTINMLCPPRKIGIILQGNEKKGKFFFLANGHECLKPKKEPSYRASRIL